jgi:transcriptional regulator with XRE-family HTH domain
MLHLSDNIKIIRELYDERQEDFVKRFSGVSLSMQKSYESGRAKPGMLYMQQLAAMTGVPVDTLKNYPVEINKIKKVSKDGKEENVGLVDNRAITDTPQPTTNTPAITTEQMDWKKAYEDLAQTHKMYAQGQLVLSQAIASFATRSEEIEKVDKHLDSMTKYFSDLTKALLLNQRKLLHHFEIDPSPLKNERPRNQGTPSASHRGTKKEKHIGEDSDTLNK